MFLTDAVVFPDGMPSDQGPAAVVRSEALTCAKPSYVAATGHLGEVEAALGHRDRAYERSGPLARAGRTPWAFDLIARSAAAGEGAAACQAVRAAESAGHPRPQAMRALVPSC